jgi:hypothetical protein
MPWLVELQVRLSDVLFCSSIEPHAHLLIHFAAAARLTLLQIHGRCEMSQKHHAFHDLRVFFVLTAKPLLKLKQP